MKKLFRKGINMGEALAFAGLVVILIYCILIGLQVAAVAL